MFIKSPLFHIFSALPNARVQSFQPLVRNHFVFFTPDSIQQAHYTSKKFVVVVK
jgi:hypothetical protein